MGNAGWHHFLEVEHPTTVSVDISVEGGYVGDPFGQGGFKAPNIVHMHNQTECATGCGATFTFQRNVKTLKTTYECKKSFESEFGMTYNVGYKSEAVAQGKGMEELKGSMPTNLAASLKISKKEVETYFVETGWKILDEAATSRAYIYHCYYNYDWVQFKWLRNELHLTPGHDLTFEYQGSRFLKIHPEHCYGAEGPHVGYGLSKSTIQSSQSRLRMSHESGRHKAFVKIAFDEKYMKNGVYIGDNYEILRTGF